jgi:hypothetical protein
LYQYCSFDVPNSPYVFTDAEIPVVELYQLQDQDESLEKCIIIGTIYKQQILKPNILKEISEEVSIY